MGTDVKIGLALGAILLVCAAFYFGTRKDSSVALKPTTDSVQEQNQKVLDQLFSNGKKSGKTPATAQSQPSDKKSLMQRNKDNNKKDSKPASSSKTTDTLASVPIANTPTKPGTQLPVHKPRLSPLVWGPNWSDPLNSNETASNSSLLPGMGLLNSPNPNSSRVGLLNTQPVFTASQQPKSNPPVTTTAKPQNQPQPVATLSSQSQPVQEHIVQEGDTFAAIADRYFHSQKYIAQLLKANPSVDPRNMKIGMKIVIPPLAQELASAKTNNTAPLGPNSYVVKDGDSFYSIAQHLLGTGAKWNELYEANKDVIGPDPSKLAVGQVLKVPANTKSPT